MILFNIEPRWCLVAGSLERLRTDRDVSVSKLKSFELYCRNTWRPEIFTLNELLNWFASPLSMRLMPKLPQKTPISTAGLALRRLVY